jgi:hypothetical protein
MGSLVLRPDQILDWQIDLQARYSHPTDFLLACLGAFASQKTAKNATSSDMMFYPYQPAHDLKQALGFARLVGRDLFTARAFQVTTRMVDVLKDLYQQSIRNIEHIDAEELPSESGFLWYDKPLELEDVKGRMVSFRAISWGPQLIRTRRKNAFTRQQEEHAEEGLRVVAWNLAGDPNSYTAEEISDMWSADRLGELQLDHVMTFPFGERFPTRDQYGGPGDSLLHYIHVTWMLLSSEVAAHHRPPALGRKAQRRAQRSLKHGEVTVITLRRTHEDKEGPEGHREVDWTCRWLVQGHHRHIESYEGPRHHAVPDRTIPGQKQYCRTCHARITWVKPCIRGPEDRPLKGTNQLYRLSR